MIVAIIQARLASTRLPRKIARLILDRPMLAWVVRRARQIPEVSLVVVAASRNPLDQWVDDWCRSGGVECVRGEGDEGDVLTRYEETARVLGLQGPDLIVRVTSDCPALDPAVSRQVIRLRQESRVDYASNLRDWPDGLDTEVFTRTALQAAYHLTGNTEDREHVTPWMRRNLFCLELPHTPNLRHVKLSVDTEDELEYVRELYEALGPDFGWGEALRVLPGRVCEGCRTGVPHVQRSRTSIGGAREYTVWDLHETTGAGGAGIAECRAWAILQRAAWLRDGTLAVRVPGDTSPKSPGADPASRPDGGDR